MIRSTDDAPLTTGHAHRTPRTIAVMTTRSKARRALATAALVLGMLPAVARANEVTRFETIGCSNYACVDTFQLKCKQASSMVCLTIETDDVDDPYAAPSWIATAIATAPTAMLGSAKLVQLPENGKKSFCMIRPNAEGTIKGLVTVSVTGSGPSPVSYTAHAQCFSGNLFDGLVSRDTTFVVRQDQ
jgi:hypothetical protein